MTENVREGLDRPDCLCWKMRRSIRRLAWLRIRSGAPACSSKRAAAKSWPDKCWAAHVSILRRSSSGKFAMTPLYSDLASAGSARGELTAQNRKWWQIVGPLRRLAVRLSDPLSGVIKRSRVGSMKNWGGRVTVPPSGRFSCRMFNLGAKRPTCCFRCTLQIRSCTVPKKRA